MAKERHPISKYIKTTRVVWILFCYGIVQYIFQDQTSTNIKYKCLFTASEKSWTTPIAKKMRKRKLQKAIDWRKSDSLTHGVCGRVLQWLITLWPETNIPGEKEQPSEKFPEVHRVLKSTKVWPSGLMHYSEMSFQGMTFFCVSILVLQEFACYHLRQNTVTWQPGKLFAWPRIRDTRR